MPSVIAAKTYGTVAAERRKAMSGLEFVRGLVEGTLQLIPSRARSATTSARSPTAASPIDIEISISLRNGE